MTQTSIRLTNLSSKVTDQFLKSNFSTVGQVLNVNVFENATGDKWAEVAFESESHALKAIEVYNGKEMIKKNVKIELVKNSKSTQNDKIELDKEIIGELVFPIAKKLYPNQAAKLTGMIVESILSLKGNKSDMEILDILSVKNFITELVEAAYKKLNL